MHLKGMRRGDDNDNMHELDPTITCFLSRSVKSKGEKSKYPFFKFLSIIRRWILSHSNYYTRFPFLYRILWLCSIRDPSSFLSSQSRQGRSKPSTFFPIVSTMVLCFRSHFILQCPVYEAVDA